jgi:hypothetical protein
MGKGGDFMKLFSFDAETNGLWGQAFAIGALVYDENEQEIARFLGRCPIEGEVNEWVQQNVIPALADVPITHHSYFDLLADFAKFYLEQKKDADIVVHMGYIVEVKILRDMHDLGLIGDWDGPYPLFDISGNLQQVGEDPTSVDKYAQKYGLRVREFGSPHNPLYDCEVAAKVYIHLSRRG